MASEITPPRLSALRCRRGPVNCRRPRQRSSMMPRVVLWTSRVEVDRGPRPESSYKCRIAAHQGSLLRQPLAPAQHAQRPKNSGSSAGAPSDNHVLSIRPSSTRSGLGVRRRKRRPAQRVIDAARGRMPLPKSPVGIRPLLDRRPGRRGYGALVEEPARGPGKGYRDMVGHAVRASGQRGELRRRPDTRGVVQQLTRQVSGLALSALAAQPPAI
jgi:hypothetical protein